MTRISLTVEEEDQVREKHTLVRGPEGSFCGECDFRWPCSVARLLATLDAERALHAVTGPEEDGLTKAARAAMHAGVQHGPRYGGLVTDAVTGPEEGLDVERLAEALWAWGFDATGPVIRDDVKEPTEGQRRMARKLAIEYDRRRALGDSR